MSAPRMSAKDYRDYLERRHGRKVKVAQGWSGSERRYFYGVLHGTGEYEGETIRITPEDVERHCYTPDFVTTRPIEGRKDVGEVLTLDDFKRGMASPKVYHEVKGNYRLQSQDAARLRWFFAAQAHPEAVFVWAKETRTQSVWDIEILFDGGRTRIRQRGVVGFRFRENGGVEWQKASRNAR